MDMHVCAHHVFVLSMNGQDHWSCALNSKKKSQNYPGRCRFGQNQWLRANLGCRTIVRCVRGAELGWKMEVSHIRKRKAGVGSGTEEGGPCLSSLLSGLYCGLNVNLNILQDVIENQRVTELIRLLNYLSNHMNFIETPSCFLHHSLFQVFFFEGGGSICSKCSLNCKEIVLHSCSVWGLLAEPADDVIWWLTWHWHISNVSGGGTTLSTCMGHKAASDFTWLLPWFIITFLWPLHVCFARFCMNLIIPTKSLFVFILTQ